MPRHPSELEMEAEVGRPSVTPGEVTARRKEVTLEVLASLYPAGADVKTLVPLLQERDDWPQSPWRGGADKPYYTGTRQHLEQMSRVGLVRREQTKRSPALTVYFIEAKALVKDAVPILALKAEGKNGVEIADRLGLQKSRVYQVMKDPTGARERERKKRYCPGCGAPKRTSLDTCRHCVEKKAQELLPPDEFTTYIDEQRRRGVELLFGVRPDLVRVIRIGTKRGWVEHELPGFQTWREALEEHQIA